MTESSASLLGQAALVGVLTINGLAFAAFGIDKLLARAGRRRIREASLLWLAGLGGTPGAYAGRAAFRHKTRKQPFSRQLGTVAAVQLLVLAAGLGWMIAG